MTAGVIKRRIIPGAAAAEMARRVGEKMGFQSNPFFGVEWSIAYVAFLAYMFAIISYKFQIGTASMTVALLTLPMERNPIRVPLVVTFLLMFLCWAGLGVVLSPFPKIVLDAVTEFAKVVAVIFVAANVLRTRARFRLAVVLIAIWWMLFPVRGTFVNYFFGGGGEQGRAYWNYIYSNPNDLAGLALLELSVVLGMLSVERHKLIRLGAQISAVSLVVVIVLTQSRGGLIALVFYGAILGKQYWRLLRNLRVLALIALTGVLIAVVTPDTAWRRFSTIKDATNNDESLIDPDLADLSSRQDQGSSRERLAIWKIAGGIISNNPMTGVGLGAYREAHALQARRPGFPGFAGGKRDTHSTYLNVTAELGIPGLLLFMSLLGIVLQQSIRARRRAGKERPALALQLLNMEVGLYAYMVAGIWGTYDGLVPTYVHLVMMSSATALLNMHATPVRRRQVAAPVRVQAAMVAEGGR
ncbi:MAG: O-antigen ligase family protein [Gemmatimonadaceae bacterium]